MFYHSLGTKKRWPINVLYGAIMDFDLKNAEGGSNSLGIRNWSARVGMSLFNPPDVSGWDIDDVWTLNRLSDVHLYLDTKVKSKILKGISKEDFVSKETFLNKFEPYHWKGNLYTLAVKICSNELVEVKGEMTQSNAVIDVEWLFENKKNKAKRYQYFLKAQENVIDNVCQFVC